MGFTESEYETIHIVVDQPGNAFWSGTTEAVIARKDVNATKSVHIVSAVQHNNVDNNGGIRASDGATVTFENLDSVYIASIGGKEEDNDSAAITASTAGWLKSQNNTVNISGKTVQIIGSVDVKSLLGRGSNQVNMELNGENSFWYGSATGESSLTTVNVSLSNGATWIYTASKSTLNRNGKLSHLTLDNGIVLLADDKIWETFENTTIDGTEGKQYVLADYRNKDAVYATVDIGHLNGSGGTFEMDINWLASQDKTYAKDGTSDFIQIGEVENGSHQFVKFDPNKANLDQMRPGDKLYFASVEAGETVFSTNVDGEEENRADELYSFNYASQSEKDTESNLTYWYLGKNLGNANENTSLLNSAALASYSLATDLDRFNERRGQSRHAERGASGPWVRYQFTSVGLDNAFDMDKHMIQVGYDADVSNSESRKIIGVAFDYTRGDTDIDGISATGDNDRYGLNFYYTVLADCGGYADFNAKIGRIGSDYDAHNSSGESIGADFWQTYYGVSAEFGYKHDFTNRLFVEPQAQMQVMRIEGADFTTDGGVRAHFEDANSLIGRVGVRAGYEFSFAESLPASSIYVVADVLREFKGDTTWRAVGRSTSYAYDENGHETWYDAGIGADLSVNRNTNLWLDTKYVFGGDYENTWSLNAGVRWMF